MDTIFQILLTLIGFGSILFLAYVTTRFVGGKTSRGYRGKYLNVVETITLGMDKKICLVKAGDDFILIAASGKKIDFLCKVNMEEFNNHQEEEINNKAFDFKSLFDNYISKYKRKEGSRKEYAAGNAAESSFKANINKLKAITGKFDNRDRKNGDEDTNEN